MSKRQSEVICHGCAVASLCRNSQLQATLQPCLIKLYKSCL